MLYQEIHKFPFNETSFKDIFVINKQRNDMIICTQLLSDSVTCSRKKSEYKYRNPSRKNGYFLYVGYLSGDIIKSNQN